MRKPVAVAVLALALAGCGRPAAPGDASEVATTPPAPSSAAIPSAAPEVPVKLSPQARNALARAKAEGARTVGVTVSTEAGQVERAAAGLRGLGATVESADAGAGYVRATVPVDEVARVPAVEGVRQVDVDEPLSNGDPAP
ncbi:lipoprotein [Saccharothrix xinjiangensis]|uniref:Lipoprotein n=1 Tax=Saccharothrix xinjiangensis TaxID=204798 RepID=A0ABV9YBV2_9PSEU